MPRISRRQFTALLATVASPFTLPHLAEGAPPRLPRFPDGFVWGCATAAYQIEGAVHEGGRGSTLWDQFAHTRGKTSQGDTGDVADDSYHRYADDVRLLKELGCKAYRFSVAWARIFPEGRGKPNEQGLAYYDRLVDELLKNGITPFPTLFHWDLPAALPGGWQSRDTPKAFADYAGFVARHLADRVKRFMTTNEIVCFTDLSYRIGQFAPGLKLEPKAVNQIRHHGVLAHGLGVQAIRANSPQGTEVGLAENPRIFVPVIETPEHIEAAKKALRLENAPFITAVLEGQYPEEYLKREGANAPRIEAGDMAIIGSPVDFVGLNIYQPEYARADDSASGYAVARRPSSFPHMASPWLFIGPEVMYWGVRAVSELWDPKSLYITENGCSGEDFLDARGRIEDTDRIMYLRNYLTHLQRATAEDYPVKGYFLWSLMDNFEWADGYGKRFGVYYVDFKTQRRIPKQSALWYRSVIDKNAVE